MAVSSLTIDDQARLLGHAVWLERRCFEVLGGWVHSTEDATAKLTFATLSRHHGEHAQELEQLLPATRDHDPAALVAPLEDGWRSRLDDVASKATVDDRVAAAPALLDIVIASHASALDVMTPVADGPAMRSLRGVVADEREDRAAL